MRWPFIEADKINRDLQILREQRTVLVMQSLNNTDPRCPCGGELYEGPSGGMCVNVQCEKCGSRFNMTPFGFDILEWNVPGVAEPTEEELKAQKTASSTPWWKKALRAVGWA